VRRSLLLLAGCGAPLTPPPTAAPFVTVTPWAPRPGERVRCDADGALAVRWWADGAALPGGPEVTAPAAGRLRCEVYTRQGAAAQEVTIVDPIRPGNLLLVIIDDLGVDRVGAYGVGAPPPTPALDALAAQGVRFDRAWSLPTCSPSRAALFTGRHAFRTGVGMTISADGGAPLGLDEVTLPELLRRAGTGHTSRLVGKWGLGSHAAGHWRNVIDQGFDAYAGVPGNMRDGSGAVDGRDQGYYDYEYFDGQRLVRRTEYLTTVEADDAIAAITTTPEPWLVVLALHAPHTPFDPPPDDLYSGPRVTPESPRPRLVDAMVEAMDRELGRVLAQVDLGTTTVVALGDNGTGEQAARAPYSEDHAKFSVYEGGVRVPLLVAGPHVRAPGSTSDALVHLVDVLPTLAELGGVRDPAAWVEAPIDGLSLLPLLVDPDRGSLRELLYTQRFLGVNPDITNAGDLRAVRDERFKLIRFSSGVEELYDLGQAWAEGEPIRPAGPAYDRLAAALDGPRFRP
jgi:arylsulfatase B